MKNFKNITAAGLVAFGAALFTGCMDSSPSAPAGPVADATLNVKVGTGTVGLGKGSTISLKKLIITLTSNATPADTVRDTIVVGQHGFLATSTTQQTIDTAYTLKPLRTWTISAKTLDNKDSVIHNSSDTISKLLAGEVRTKTLNLAPRFVMYKANFNFPDSIASTTGPDKQKMTITRLIMKVNGTTVVDSSGTFNASTAYAIGYDYVPVNTGTTVQLSVIGNLTGWSLPGDTTLYNNSSINVAGLVASQDSSQTVNLPWVGPVTGVDQIHVVIQKVGLIQLNGTTTGTPIPKKPAQ